MNKNAPDNDDTEPSAPSDEISDGDLFLAAIGDVKRLQHDRVPPQRGTAPLPASRESVAERDDRSVMEALLDDLKETDFLETGEHLAWTRPGVQRSVLKRLKAGRYAIQGEIDLHGLKVAEARVELSDFLHTARERERLCLRIIHGKGRRHADSAPRLKQAVNQWLQRHRNVLAFCSARISDGGTGAVYVLLARKR